MISIPGRIPIHIFPFFWLLVLIIGWLNSATVLGTLIWALVILVSVLIHEYGHALTAIAFGQSAEINLVGLGGLTKREGPKLPKWKEFLIVLNGPLAGFLTFFILFQLLGYVEEKRSILFYALEIGINVNLFWTILNLIPVLPLDGGHLFRILLEGIFGLRGLKAAFLISIILASLMGFYFLSIHQVLMGALFFMLGFESYRAWADIKSLSSEDENEDLQLLLKEGKEELKAGSSEKALEKFSYIRAQAPKGMIYVAATQYAARILADQGNIKEAYHYLYPLKSRLSIEYLQLLQQLAYQLQEWEESAKIGEQAYQIHPSIDVALLNAYSNALMGKITPTVGWLSSAIHLGFSNVREIIQKREFDSIRETDAFQNWLKKSDFYRS